jgi:peroxiredoxin
MKLSPVRILTIIGMLALAAAPALANCGSCGPDAHASEAEASSETPSCCAVDAEPTAAELGEPAPDFTLTDAEGAEHTLSDYEGKTVVLAWVCPTCPFIVRHYDAGTFEALAAGTDPEEVVFLKIDSTYNGEDEQTTEVAEELEQTIPVLFDRDGTVGRLYKARWSTTGRWTTIRVAASVTTPTVSTTSRSRSTRWPPARSSRRSRRGPTAAVSSMRLGSRPKPRPRTPKIRAENAGTHSRPAR